MNPIPQIEEHFGISGLELEVTRSIKTAPIVEAKGEHKGLYKGVNIYDGIRRNERYFKELSHYSILRDCDPIDENDPNYNGHPGFEVLDNRTIIMSRTAYTFNKKYREYVSNGKFIYNTKVQKLDNGVIRVETFSGYNAFLVAQSIEAGILDATDEINKMLSFGVSGEVAGVVLSTNIMEFTPANSGVDPVYTFELDERYESGVCILTPVIHKDGEHIQDPRVRWEWVADVPEGFTGTARDTETARELRISTDSRNRSAIFIPTPRFKVTGYFAGENSKGLPTNETCEFEKALQLPEYVIPLV